LDILTDPDCGWTVSVLIGGFYHGLGILSIPMVPDIPSFKIEVVAIA